jgi:MtfA peptidase
MGISGGHCISAIKAHLPCMNPIEITSAVAMSSVAALALAGALAVAAQPWWTRRRRAQVRAQPFPAAWRRILRKRVPAVAQLPANLQRRLKQHIQVFLAEKAVVGCQGQEVNDDVRVTIAAQACLLLLGEASPAYFPKLKRILVYPGAFLVQHERPVGDGTLQVQARALAGESWAQGQVILSWADVQAGAANAADGRNVVLHEFAHQIDQDSGQADGRPWLASKAARRRWDGVMGEAFERLRQESPSWVDATIAPLNDALNAPLINPLIDAYGATDPAEFFAVVTEVFFERPDALKAQAPEVFRELAGLYRVDPTAW